MVILRLMTVIKAFTFNPFEENTYVLSDDSGEAVVIDPGCYEKEEQQELTDYIETQQLEVKLLLNTHAHIDHVLGNDFVKEHFKVKLLVHPLERPVLKAVTVYAPNYGFTHYREASPDEDLSEGKPVTFGITSLDVIWLPGHAPGHVGFYSKKEKFLIGGDVLFYHSIGRTDLPGGNHHTLLNSIRNKLFTLPDDVTIYPGHGVTTTIGEEKINNPFCALSLS